MVMLLSKIIKGDIMEEYLRHKENSGKGAGPGIKSSRFQSLYSHDLD